MSTRRALFFSFLDRYSGLVLAVLSSIAIARLLKPEEIGVFSVAMAMLAFAATLRDMGAGQYLVQTQEVTAAHIKAVWTLQFFAGVVLALVLTALAYPMAALYKEPRLTPIIGVMALTYLVTPFGSVTYALLMRDMRFQHVAVMRFAAGLVGSVVSVGLAFDGLGPISLAWGQLAASCTTAVVSQLYRRTGQPWGFSLKGAREVLGFGSFMTGTSLVSTFASGMPDFALGKFQDMTAAGLYSRSNGLVAMFHRLMTDAVSGVALAHFAKGKRDSTDPSPDFLRAIHYLVTLNTAFAVCMVALAEPVTRVLYGNQWGDSVELTRWLALAAVFFSPQPVCAALIIGCGRADLMLKATLTSGTILIVATLAGAWFGLRELGVALVLANMACSAIWLTAARQVCSFRLNDIYKTMFSSVITAILSCIPLLIFTYWAGPTPNNALLTTVFAIPIFIVGLIGAILITKHPLANDMRNFITRYIPGSTRG